MPSGLFNGLFINYRLEGFVGFGDTDMSWGSFQWEGDLLEIVPRFSNHHFDECIIRGIVKVLTLVDGGRGRPGVFEASLRGGLQGLRRRALRGRALALRGLAHLVVVGV